LGEGIIKIVDEDIENPRIYWKTYSSKEKENLSWI